MAQVAGSVANTILAIVFILGSCVFIHELGHFVTAKLAGMRVEEFMVGFPPRLVSFVRRDTRYGIGLIPFGGFCRIAGMEPGQEEVERGFYTRPRYWQAMVIVAGVCMNVVLGIAIFTLVGTVWGVMVGQARPPQVDSLLRGDTPARRAGLQPGDSIMALDGERFSLEIAKVRPGSVAAKLGLNVGDTVYRTGEEYLAVPADLLRVARGARAPLQLQVAPAAVEDQTAEVRTVQATLEQLGAGEGAPAKADLSEVWGVTFSPLSAPAARLYVMERPNRPIRLTVLRDGAERELTVTPKAEAAQVGDEDGEISREEIGQIGITFRAVRNYDAGYALRRGLGDSQAIIRTIADMIYRFVTHRGGFEGTGPVGMAFMAHKEAQLGPEAVLNLCGIISLNLALINLLPIPIADGGRLVLIGYEAVVRRRVNPRHEMAWLMAGLVFVFIALVAITVKDVWNLVVHKVP